MKIHQTALASLLAFAIIAALPGVYMYTEGGQAGTATNRAPAKDFKVVDAEPVPKPDPSDLPNTSFQLHTLTPRQQKQVQWKLAIDLNTATAKRLQSLSGVGPATAQNIIRYRNQHGGFRSIEGLDNVSGIGPATLEKFRGKVKISGKMSKRKLTRKQSTRSQAQTGSTGPKINVNTASSQQLQKLSGVGPATADNIISYRDKHGYFRSPEDLQKISGIGPATVSKMEPRITF